jgi:hypothetical protein
MIHRMIHYAYKDLIVQGGKLILVVDTYKIAFKLEHVVLINRACMVFGFGFPY